MCVEVSPCAGCSRTTSANALVSYISRESKFQFNRCTSKFPSLLIFFISFPFFPLHCCSVGKRSKQMRVRSQTRDPPALKSSYRGCQHLIGQTKTGVTVAPPMPCRRSVLLSIHYQPTSSHLISDFSCYIFNSTFLRL